MTGYRFLSLGCRVYFLGAGRDGRNGVMDTTEIIPLTLIDTVKFMCFG